MEPLQPSYTDQQKATLDRLRNMWEFSNLAQFLFIFGKVLKIDQEVGIEELEHECLSPGPSKLFLDIGLVLLKFISTQRGLNAEMFDDYMRREYRKRLSRQLLSRELRGYSNDGLGENPFGEDEEPKSFQDLDIFQQVEILQQLTQWIFEKPEHLRERMNQTELEQYSWRIDIYGWDAEDREYLLLDDNRLYRRTDPSFEGTPPPPPPKPKANSKKAKAARRASRRLERINAKNGVPQAHDEEREDTQENDTKPRSLDLQWECIAITLEDYNSFLATLAKSRDENEKNLRARIIEEVIPVIEKAQEGQKRKALKREKELQALEKLAGAKRSSRVAQKMERQKLEADAAAAQRQAEVEAAQAQKEEKRQQKLDEERALRLRTREKRAAERESRRRKHEEELMNLTTENARIERGEVDGKERMSERHLKAREQSLRRELEELAEEEWCFDCSVCGKHGRNMDDGKRSIACDKCSVWQHVDCLGLGDVADDEAFEFTCKLCLQKIEDAKKAAANPPIKLKISRLGLSSSPPTASGTAQNLDLSSSDCVYPQSPSKSPSFRMDQASKGIKRSSTALDAPDAHPSKRSKHEDRPKNPEILGASLGTGTQSNGSATYTDIMDGPSLSPQGQLPRSIASYEQLHEQPINQSSSHEQSADRPSKKLVNGTGAHPEASIIPGKPNGAAYQASEAMGTTHPTERNLQAQYTPSRKELLSNGALFTPDQSFSSVNRNTSHIIDPGPLFDNEASTPRVNLPPSSSPHSHIGANGTLPHSSTGLSPTKHLTTYSTPPSPPPPVVSNRTDSATKQAAPHLYLNQETGPAGVMPPSAALSPTSHRPVEAVSPTKVMTPERHGHESSLTH